MLPRIGKTVGRPSSRANTGEGRRRSAGRHGHGRATVAVSDSDDSSFGESDESPVKPSTKSLVRGVTSQNRDSPPSPGLGMTSKQRETQSRNTLFKVLSKSLCMLSVLGR